jgi:hypothetical protein
MRESKLDIVLELVDPSPVLYCKGATPKLTRTNKPPIPKQNALMTGRA